jgi:hypothetical protein
MHTTHSFLSPSRIALLIAVAFSGVLLSLSVDSTAHAAVFDGGGLEQGMGALAGVTGVPTGDVRGTVVRLIGTVLSFMALAATVIVIIAGIMIVTSFGNDDRVEKAKSAIKYALIGLVVLLFARAIVSLVTVYFAGEIVS